MPKRHDTIQRIKNNWRVDHLIVVQLAEIFNFRDPSLIEFEIILF